MRHTFLTFTWVKSFKRFEVKSEATHFLTFMNNGKTFPSIDGMSYPSQCPDQLKFLLAQWRAERYWICWDLQTFNLLQRNPNSTRNNMKFKIKNKKEWKRKFVKLVIPKLNKIISYQFLFILLKGKNYEQWSQNNQSTWCLPSPN